MTSKICYRAAMHVNVNFLETNTDRNSGSVRLRRLQILSIVLMLLVSVAPMVGADPYEVLVVDITAADDLARIEEYTKDAAKFNALHSKGYSAARPYFNVLNMVNAKVYFVFGFRGEVQGIHRQNYSGTIENLRCIKHKGVLKYPHMHWLPVEKIRKLLTAH